MDCPETLARRERSSASNRDTHWRPASSRSSSCVYEMNTSLKNPCWNRGVGTRGCLVPKFVVERGYTLDHLRTTEPGVTLRSPSSLPFTVIDTSAVNRP